MDKAFSFLRLFPVLQHPRSNACSADCCEMLLVNAADGEEQIAGGS